jgi:hypothetical protein
VVRVTMSRKNWQARGARRQVSMVLSERGVLVSRIFATPKTKYTVGGGAFFEGAARLCKYLIWHSLSLPIRTLGLALQLQYDLGGPARKHKTPARRMTMRSTYDIFRKFPDGESIWIEAVYTLELAHSRLANLIKVQPGDYILYDLSRQQVIAETMSR